MALVVMALEEDRAVDFQVPESDCTLFVTCRNKTAVLQESHATELRVLRSLHLSDDLKLVVVP